MNTQDRMAGAAANRSPELLAQQREYDLNVAESREAARRRDQLKQERITELMTDLFTGVANAADLAVSTVKGYQYSAEDEIRVFMKDGFTFRVKVEVEAVPSIPARDDDED